MNLKEYLLSCLAEECCEVGQRCSKAQRFGLLEVQPGQELDNAERIGVEIVDLFGVIELLQEKGYINLDSDKCREQIEAKKAKVMKFMAYSVEQGALTLET